MPIKGVELHRAGDQRLQAIEAPPHVAGNEAQSTRARRPAGASSVRRPFPEVRSIPAAEWPVGGILSCSPPAPVERALTELMLAAKRANGLAAIPFGATVRAALLAWLRLEGGYGCTWKNQSWYMNYR